MWTRVNVGLVIAVCLAGYQYFLIRERQRERCFKAFLNNNFVGASIYGGIVVDFLLRIPLFPSPDIAITR